MNAEYHVDITAFPFGQFRAMDRKTGNFIISPDPESDWCHAMRDEPDGPVQFYRDGVPSLSHSSVHKMGKSRIELGQRFPYRRVKRQEWQGIRRQVNAHGDSEA